VTLSGSKAADVSARQLYQLLSCETSNAEDFLDTGVAFDTP